MLPRGISTLYASYLAKDENECEVRKARKTNFLSAIVAVFAGITSIATFVNQLTPTFTGLVDFRVRNILSLAFLASIMGLCVYIMSSRHLCKSAFIGQEIGHFNYSRTRRIVAFYSSVLALAAIAVALSDFRYWFGVDGPIQGRVIDVSGHPVAAAVVDAMNRDDRSVCQSPQRTVSNGGFVLDLEPTRGHAAYFTVKATKCELRQPITTPMLNFVSRKDNPNENSILLRLSCPGD